MKFFAKAKKPNEVWADWFAWFPVSVEPSTFGYAAMWVWLEKVERKEGMWYGGRPTWRYREKIVTPNGEVKAAP